MQSQDDYETFKQHYPPKVAVNKLVGSTPAGTAEAFFELVGLDEECSFPYEPPPNPGMFTHACIMFYAFY